MNPTLLDVTKRLDPNGKIDAIVEILTQTNDVLTDMTWLEGNLPTGHRTTIRTGIPEPTFRKLYGFVQPSKTTTAQITDTCGMMEAYAEIDKALADLNGNSEAFRLSEHLGIIEGFNIKLTKTLFDDGNEATTPEAFTGFRYRYNDSSAANKENIIEVNPSYSSGETTTDIWLGGWGPNTVHGIQPKGSKAGLQKTEKGQVTKESAAGLAEMYRTHYRWDCGLSVRDWRYVVRICNILTSDLDPTDTALLTAMSQAVELIPSLGMCRPVFYTNRTVKTALKLQLADQVKNSTLTMEQVGGKPVMMFQGVPVHRCDGIGLNKTGVV